MRTPISFALGLAAGAAAMHFLGARERRDALRDQAKAKAAGAKSAVQTQAANVANQAKGAAHAVTPSGTRLENPDDVTLARKVETEIFRDAQAPKGEVSVDVQAGVAYLRGVADEPWIVRLEDDARKVDGIKGVKNLLHRPGTPAPAAEPRGAIGERL
jgi:osmotically-inducible protein OsmY